MTIGQVKALLAKLFPLNVREMKLNYKSSSSDWPEQLDDDTKTLSYYGVGSGGVISMENVFGN